MKSGDLVSKDFFPSGFVPGTNDVIIGRGKKCNDHIGNKQLRCLVAAQLDIYSAATTKAGKSQILSSILSQIRNSYPKGYFVKYDSETGLWFDIGNFLAREKISQAFRDALQGEYKSSTTYKKKRRRDQKLGLFTPGKKSRICDVSKLRQSKEKPKKTLTSSRESIEFLDALSRLASSFGVDEIRNNDPFEPRPILEHRIKLKNEALTKQKSMDVESEKLVGIDLSELRYILSKRGSYGLKPFTITSIPRSLFQI